MLQFWQHSPRIHLAVSMPRSSRHGIRLHRHNHPFHEIGFVFEGECEWQLDGRHKLLRAGDLLIVPAALHHSEKTPGRTQARLGWIGFDFADDYAELPAPTGNVLSAGSYRADIQHLHTVICAERQGQALANTERAELALRELLILICRLSAADSRAPVTPPGRITKADHTAQLTRSAALTLSGNLSQPMRIRDLAHYHSLSTAHFAALFKKHQGVSPSRYLQNARLERAQAHLTGDKLTIKEIAAACGYVDAAHFCHAFKAATGRTPRQWRAAPDLKPSVAPAG